MLDCAQLAREQRIAEQTAHILAQGVELFQIFQLHDDPVEHARRYVQFAGWPLHQRLQLVDMGAGVGGMVKLIRQAYPNLLLEAILVNNHQYQHEHSDGGIPWLADMTDTKLRSHAYDVVMFNYSLGYVPLEDALREAARLLRVGGQMIVWDLDGESPELEADTGYHVSRMEDVHVTAVQAGFYKTAKFCYPTECSLRTFQRVCPEYWSRFCRVILPRAKPVLMTFILTGRALHADRPAVESVTAPTVSADHLSPR